MFSSVTQKKGKGDKIVGLLAKLTYLDNVRQNPTLVSMFQQKLIKNIRKGDRIVIPAGVTDTDADEDIQIDERELIPISGTHQGILVFEITTTVQDSTIGPKGVTFNVSLIATESSNTQATNDRWDYEDNEELFIVIPETLKDKNILVLNDAIRVPKRETSKSESIGSAQLALFSGNNSAHFDDNSKEGRSRETIQRIKAVRSALFFLRTTESAKHDECVLLEGGLKKDQPLLKRILAVCRDNRSKSTATHDPKWIGIQTFNQFTGLKLASDQDAFQDAIVMGHWSEEKYGKLFDMLLSDDETANDANLNQLTAIVTRWQGMLAVSKGQVWNTVATNVITRLEAGTLGRLLTAQVKHKLEEMIHTCNHLVCQDNNITTLTINGLAKEYDLNKGIEVVSLYRDTLDSITETDYATQVEFINMLASRRTEAGKKHSLEREESNRPTKPAKPNLAEASKSKKGGKMIKGAHSTSQKVEFIHESAGNTSTAKKQWLCLFNLQHQLMGKKDCKKGVECDRDHYDMSQKGSAGYCWTKETMLEQVNKASSAVFKPDAKKKLITAVQEEWSA